jgi:hypothetical protein
VCNSIHIDLTSFKLHVPQAAHQSALLALKEKIKLRKEEELVVPFSIIEKKSLNLC